MQRPRPTRRAFLRGAAVLAGGALLLPGDRHRILTPADVERGALPVDPNAPFPVGVWSGVSHVDSAHRVVIGTRTAPFARRVRWTFAADPAFEHPVAEGIVTTGPDNGDTVKVVVSGLTPDCAWWYRFEAIDPLGRVTGRSRTGRTRTFSRVGAPSAELRLAVVACQAYSSGYYGAFADISTRPVDAIVHLGDAIYEYDAPFNARISGHEYVRLDPTPEAFTLAGYRRKHLVYRSDPNAQAALARHPLVPIWDDHEIVNNVYRDQISAHRFEAARRAWFEYMPVEGTHMAREVRFGNLASLALVDGRSHRSARRATFLGDSQTAWLGDVLAQRESDGVAWKLIANPSLMSAREDPRSESWHCADRELSAILETIQRQRVRDVAVLTGDIHAFGVGTVRRDAAHCALEMTVGAVSSNTSTPRPASGNFTAYNDRDNGYTLVAVRPDALVAAFMRVDAHDPDCRRAVADTRVVLPRYGTEPQVTAAEPGPALGFMGGR